MPNSIDKKNKEDPISKFCVYCGARARRSAEACSACGRNEFADIKENEKRAVDSISSAAPEYKFCSLCGTRYGYDTARCEICGGINFADSFEQYAADKRERIERLVESKCDEMYERMRSDIVKRLRKDITRLFSAPGVLEILEKTEKKNADKPDKPKETRGGFATLKDYPTLENYDKHSFIINGTSLEKYFGSSGDVLIPYGVVRIEPHAFDNNEVVKTVVIPDSVKTIGGWAFCSCRFLTAVELPDSLEEIGNHAFASCVQLESVHIPKNVERIGQGVFGSCEKLESMTVDPENATYVGVDNCIIDRMAKILVCGFAASKIPDDGSVTAIGDWAITGHRKLKSILIPAPVKKIGMYAFGWCNFMSNIIYDGTLEQWYRVSKCTHWNNEIARITVHCRDGEDIITKY